MRVIFCGVRGSTPAPGAEFVRYGGQTSCVAIAHGEDDPVLVLDGGTGLRTLTRRMERRAFRGSILIGHLHWDHTHGLPFFRSGDHPDARVRVLIPEQGDASHVMARAIAPPHFPVRLEELNGDWTIDGLEPGEHDIEGFHVTALDIPHKESRTFGFRVSDGRASIAYLSDHWPTSIGPGVDGLGEIHDAATRLVKDADLLIHDAQYTAEELPARADFGHSAIEYAVRLAKECGVRTLALYHHDPERTDTQIDAIVAAHADAGVSVLAATEGDVLDL